MKDLLNRLFVFFRNCNCAPSAPLESPVIVKQTPVNRRFDSSVQKTREPIKDRQRFAQLCTQFYSVYYESLAFMAKDDAIGLRRNFGEALRIADELVAMEPLRGIPWTCRAQALMPLGRLAEAIEACDRALEIDPSDPNKWDLRGKILTFFGKNAEAEDAFKRAKSLSS